jgi:hypothetical protein
MRSVGLAAAKSLRWGFRFPTSSLELELAVGFAVEQSLRWGAHSPTRLGLGYLGLAVGKSQVEEPTPPFCWSICVHFQFLGVAEGVVEYAVLLGFARSRRMSSFEDSVTAEALQLFLSRMVKRGGEFRWSCDKLNGGLGWGSPKGCSCPDPVPVLLELRG